MSSISFGQVIPVLGPVLGFVGTVSRQGERVIASREVNPSATLNLNFGDPAVIIANATGGYYDSVADFIAAAASNVGLLAKQWAGAAVREVKTEITYPVNSAPGTQVVGYYAPKQMADVLERGSMTVALAVGTPNTQDQVYTRVVVNSAVAAGVIGDYETNPAATDLFTVEATTQTQGSTSLTIASGTNTKNGQLVFGAGILPGTYVVSGGGTTAIVLSQAATLTSAGNIVTFSNLFPLPNVVARTGYVDANGNLEITIKVRDAA